MYKDINANSALIFLHYLFPFFHSSYIYSALQHSIYTSSVLLFIFLLDSYQPTFLHRLYVKPYFKLCKQLIFSIHSTFRAVVNFQKSESLLLLLLMLCLEKIRFWHCGGKLWRSHYPYFTLLFRQYKRVLNLLLDWTYYKNNQY